MEQYRQNYDDEWYIYDRRDIHYKACCDCGLVHEYIFVPLDEHRVAIKAIRNKEETEELREALGVKVKKKRSVKDLG